MKEYRFTKTFVVVEEQEDAVWISTCSANWYRDILKLNGGDHVQTRNHLREMHGEDFLRIDGITNHDIQHKLVDNFGFGSLEIAERVHWYDK